MRDTMLILIVDLLYLMVLLSDSLLLRVSSDMELDPLANESQQQQQYEFRAIIVSSDQRDENADRIETYERYSIEQQRSIVQLISQKDGYKQEIHYYDSRLDIRLKILQDECLKSGSNELNDQLYPSISADRISKLMNALCRGCKNYLTGSVSFIILLKEQRSIYQRPIRLETNQRTQLTTVHLSDIKLNHDSKTSIDLTAYYNKMINNNADLDHELPSRIKLTIKINGDTRFLIKVRYYQFKVSKGDRQEDDIYRPEVINDLSSFSFPQGIGCSRVLASYLFNETEEVKLLKAQYAHLREFSLMIQPEVRPTDTTNKRSSTFYALDLEAKLLRKDTRIGGHHDLSSTTIYYLSQNRKYNIISKDNMAPRSGIGGVSRCFSSWLNYTSLDRFEFINWDKLVYLGEKSLDNSLNVKVFEESKNEKSKTFWWLNSIIDITNNIHERDIYVTYYFGSSTLSRIDITIRDHLSKIILQQKQMIVTNFFAGKSSDSPNGIQTIKLFSLSEICQFHMTNKKAQMIALIEIDRNDNDDIDARSIIHNPKERNSILIKSLIERFHLPKTSIISIESQIIVSTTKLAIEFDLELCDEDYLAKIEDLELIHLGHDANIIAADSKTSSTIKTYTGIDTLEDCGWLAYRCLIDSNIERATCMFTYTKGSECTIDIVHQADGKIYSHSTDQQSDRHIYMIRRGATRSETNSRDLCSFFNIKPFHIIGSKLSIKIQNHDVRFRFSQIKLYGRFNRATNEDPLSSNQRLENRFPGISWVENEFGSRRLIHNNHEDRTQIDLNIKFDTVMTEIACNSHCLLDISCNSYSFCSGYTFKDARCLLSSVDVSNPSINDQLRTLSDNSLNGRASRHDRISLGLQEPEVAIETSRTCSIKAKSCSGLFERGYKITMGSKQRDIVSRSVVNMEECAKECFRKSIDYLRDLAIHKIDFETIVAKQQQLESSESIWVSMSNRSREQVKELCSSFFYTEDLTLIDDTTSAPRACIISNHEEPRVVSIDEPSSSNQTISMIMYKFVYKNLYSSIAGFHLRSTGLDDSSKQPDYGRLIVDHSAGINYQIKVPMDDIESCARACTLQIHGPKPFCSSFDFVINRMSSLESKYCLLNSQSLHDIRHRAGQMQQVLEHEGDSKSRYWHFEPQESILRLNELTGRKDNYYGTKQFEHNYHSKLMSILILTIGLICGLSLGIKCSYYVLEFKRTMTSDRDPIEAGNRRRRFIHRLSGVRLSHLEKVQVQMS